MQKPHRTPEKRLSDAAIALVEITGPEKSCVGFHKVHKIAGNDRQTRPDAK